MTLKKTPPEAPTGPQPDAAAAGGASHHAASKTPAKDAPRLSTDRSGSGLVAVPDSELRSREGRDARSRRGAGRSRRGGDDVDMRDVKDAKDVKEHMSGGSPRRRVGKGSRKYLPEKFVLLMDALIEKALRCLGVGRG